MYNCDLHKHRPVHWIDKNANSLVSVKDIVTGNLFAI